MSCKIRKETKFRNAELLKESLKLCNIKYEIENNKIVIPEWEYYGKSFFELKSDCYILQYDEDISININEKLQEIDKIYNERITYYTTKQKIAERQEKYNRYNYEYMQNNIKEAAEKHKEEQYAIANHIEENASNKGYSVDKKIVDDKIVLVLVKY